MTSDNVRLILDVCSYVQYDSDYFVSAWDTPNQPNVGNHSDFKLVNIDSVSEILSATGTGTSYAYGSGYVTNNSGAVSMDNGVGGADAPFISPMIQVSSNRAAVTPIS